MEPFNDTDTISRQAALDAFGLSEKTRKYGGDHSGYNTMMLYEIQSVLENLPSAQDIEPERKKGTWIRENVVLTSNPPQYRWLCSECGRTVHGFTAEVLTDYCPNCGADMRGDSNEKRMDV